MNDTYVVIHGGVAQEIGDHVDIIDIDNLTDADATIEQIESAIETATYHGIDWVVNRLRGELDDRRKKDADDLIDKLLDLRRRFIKDREEANGIVTDLAYEWADLTNDLVTALNYRKEN